MRRTPNNSIDGFARSAGNKSQHRGDIFAQGSKNMPNQNRRIGDFSLPHDGLAPSDRSRSVQAGSSMKPAFDDEPVIISKKKPGSKRRLFGLLPPKKPHKRWRNMSKKRKVFTVLAWLIVVVLLVFGFLVFKGYINVNKVLKGGGGAAALDTNVDPSKLKGEGDGRVNILLLGKGGDGHEAPDLTDTIIIASIDPIAKEASLLSVPRDLYVPVKGSGSMKINAVYSTGKEALLSKLARQKLTNSSATQAEDAGFSLLEQTITENLGLPIHYHAIIDFGGFKQAVDTVGGIDLNAPTAVSEVMRIDGKNYKLDVRPGQQHMDGFEALAYSRSRHTSARGDFDRSERQRLIILALKEKVLSAGTFSNPSKISGLLDNLGNHVATNFSIQDLQRLYNLSKELESSKITSIGLADPPNNFVVTDNIGGASVVVPRAGVSNFSEIKSYLRNSLKDSFIRNENASITVLNGTQAPGLATQKADELKSFGYGITTIANAPTKTYTKTVIVDMRSGAKRYTKSYLEKRFGVAATTSLPDPAIVPGTADFVIILGTDQSTTQQ